MTCVKQWRADEEPAPFEESLSPRRRSILFIHLSFFKCGQIGGQHEWLGEHRWTGSSWVTLLCLRHTNSWNKCALIKQPLAVTKWADVQGPSVSNGGLVWRARHRCWSFISAAHLWRAHDLRGLWSLAHLIGRCTWTRGVHQALVAKWCSTFSDFFSSS